ncbi:hypothetical protein [Streptomyces sp. NPDC093598]|uniref:hypothetical protein n=1 Tax=Streptomyces sp. NPDC093598 TaxID=3366046 RepID=UPI00380A9815
MLWVGTSTGTLIEVGIEAPQAVEHDVLAGIPVSAMSRTATGEIVIVDGTGDLLLLPARATSTKAEGADATAPQAAVAAFLEAPSEVPDDGDLWAHLVTTDGERTWEPDDLETVATASVSDPSWLQLRAVINSARDLND